jgi:hypothetical protein
VSRIACQDEIRADEREEELDGSTHTPFSEDTSSDEVLVLAREWIRKCADSRTECPNKLPTDEWYYSLLLDLGKVTLRMVDSAEIAMIKYHNY